MATIRDVAKLANVSVATVSRVLNGSSKVSAQAREAVLKAQRELDFHLNANARTLARKDSEIIGVTVSDLSDPYFGSMVRACENAAHKLGCSLLVCQGLHEEQREIVAIENLLSHHCRGMIVHALTVPDERLSDYMRRVPSMVLINREIPGFEDRCVNIDNEHGEYLAVSQLIAAGHRDIAYVGSRHSILDAKERLAGYQRALKSHNLPLKPSLVVADEPLLDGGVRAAKELISRGVSFTAVAVYNDTMAAGLISVLNEMGISVPDDVSVVGFDDIMLARCLNPPLSTITNPVEEMGEAAVRLSSSLYHKDRQAAALPEFEVRFVSRKSIAPPPAKRWTDQLKERSSGKAGSHESKVSAAFRRAQLEAKQGK